MIEYLNKWILFPYLKNNDLDYLIHQDDLEKIYSLGLVKCIGVVDDYLKVKDKSGVYRVKLEGVKRSFPNPKFIWNDKVIDKKKPELILEIDDFFWHHSRNEFIYTLKNKGKKSSKRYSENDLFFYKTNPLT